MFSVMFFCGHGVFVTSPLGCIYHMSNYLGGAKSFTFCIFLPNPFCFGKASNQLVENALVLFFTMLSPAYDAFYLSRAPSFGRCFFLKKCQVTRAKQLSSEMFRLGIGKKASRTGGHRGGASQGWRYCPLHTDCHMKTYCFLKLFRPKQYITFYIAIRCVWDPKTLLGLLRASQRCDEEVSLSYMERWSFMWVWVQIPGWSLC